MTEFNRNKFSGNFTCLEVIFVLKRRLGYYLFHTYIPTCLIVIMSVSKLSYYTKLISGRLLKKKKNNNNEYQLSVQQLFTLLH